MDGDGRRRNVTHRRSNGKRREVNASRTLLMKYQQVFEFDSVQREISFSMKVVEQGSYRFIALALSFPSTQVKVYTQSAHKTPTNSARHNNNETLSSKTNEKFQHLTITRNPSQMR
jgi:hypothetical protein